MRRLVTIAVVLAACVGAFVLSGASDKNSERTYRIVFDNAFGLTQGGDFRVGGVKAGKTDSFDVKTTKGHAPKAVVIAKITQPGFDDFRKDAHCTILPQSLIGEYYVDCQPGSSKSSGCPPTARAPCRWRRPSPPCPPTWCRTSCAGRSASASA